jgi:hypothetical protein
MTGRLLFATFALCAAAGANANMVSAADRAERAVMVAQMQGVWTGTFRRYAPDGTLVETLPSRIEVRFPQGAAHDYHQTNVLTLADGKEQRLETYGRWDGRVLRYSSARIDGSFARATEDPTGLSSVLFMRFKDGSGMNVSEIVTVSPDGTRRMRAAQYIVHGRIVRRTMIDEVRASPSGAVATP